MFATIDELSDEPVSVTAEGDRVRIRYGRGATFSLDIGEALALVEAVGAALEQSTSPLSPKGTAAQSNNVQRIEAAQ